MCQDALQKSGFTEQLKYIANNNNRENNTEENEWRKRKIAWFKLPYSMNIRTNIGKTVFEINEKTFPKWNSII